MKHIICTTGLLITLVLAPALMRAGEPADATSTSSFTLTPIGRVVKNKGRTCIVLDKKYEPGLLGLDQFSHLNVFWWFSNNDNPQRRSVLQVHPHGDKANPLRGVFATRAPLRPNLIALTRVRIISIKGTTIEIDQIDAFDGTPILDLKPYLPGYDSLPREEKGVKMPEGDGSPEIRLRP